MLCPPHAALFFNDPATTEIYTLSLHDALPIYPTKTIDQVERLTEHTLRHARIHNQLASNPQYAGGIGWCAFDYNTHADFGSGDRICYHGVTDIFREPKPAARFYKSQCDPAE